MKRILLASVALIASPAYANFDVTAGTGTHIFAIDTGNQGTSLCAAASTECPAAVIVNTAGTPLGTASLPLQVSLANTGANGTALVATVSQATAANLKAQVVGTGTFAVQAAQSGTWTVDPTTSDSWALGATGSAVPSTASYTGVSSSGVQKGVVGCDSHKFLHITTATDTVVVQGVTSKIVKVCGALAWFNGTNQVFLENTASTNNNCSSTLTQISGQWSGLSQSVGGFLGAFWTGFANTSGNGLCVNSTGTGAVDLDVFYTQGS
jgi:hypothetical protein